MEASSAGRAPASTPEVAVVIPCYNTQAFIREAVESVLAQTLKNIEFVVVNDGSTDKSVEMIDDLPVRVYSQPNMGLSAARNSGLRETSAPFVVFLDADDQLYPDALEVGLATMKADPSLTMAFGGNFVVDRDGNTLESNEQVAGVFDYWDVLGGVTPSPSQCIYRRSTLEQVGAFDPNVRWGEDWECHLRMTQLGPIACHGKTILDYRSHPGQMTRKPSAIMASMLGVLRTNEKRYSQTRADTLRFQKARRHWATYFGQFIPMECVRSVRRGDLRHAWRSGLLFAQYLPYSMMGFGRFLRKKLFAAQMASSLTSSHKAAQPQPR